MIKLLARAGASTLPRLGGIPAVCNRPHLQRTHARPVMSAGGGSCSPAGVSIVFVTVPTKDVGEKIGRSLVEGRLAACVNIIPGLTSIYRWEGKVQADEELLLKIKTRSELVPRLTAEVRQLHPYDECEVTAVDVSGGSESYLKWVMDSTSSTLEGS